MYGDFTRDWLSKGSGEEAEEGCQSLWVYGDPVLRLPAFRAEILGLSPTAAFADSANFLGFYRWWQPPPMEEKTFRPELCVSTSTTQMFKEANLAVFDVRVDELVGRSLSWLDQVIDSRYSHGRRTVVLCDVDPVSAYNTCLPGQHETSLPRIVGRILENGDAVEVQDDGVYCAEFVFDERASSDYRVEILRERLGRVAIVRGRIDPQSQA